MIFTNIRMNSRYAMVFMGLLFLLALGFASSGQAGEGVKAEPTAFSDDLRIIEADVIFNQALDVFVFEQRLEGNAGSTTPQARGQLDGAPVLAYVFVTDLKPQAVGFGAVDNGILALAVTSHPDFDDTPLWDENGDRVYDNDGVIYHTHWVVLVNDTRVDGGLSVFQFQEGQTGVILPPTNPGMLIYLDSPGFQVNLKGKKLQVIVPAYRIKSGKYFNFDAVTAYLQVNTSDKRRPMLGVYKVYDVLSKDLSLPFKVHPE